MILLVQKRHMGSMGGIAVRVLASQHIPKFELDLCSLTYTWTFSDEIVVPIAGQYRGRQVTFACRESLESQ
jgi:hypothetical protein